MIDYKPSGDSWYWTFLHCQCVQVKPTHPERQVVVFLSFFPQRLAHVPVFVPGDQSVREETWPDQDEP